MIVLKTHVRHTLHRRHGFEERQLLEGEISESSKDTDCDLAISHSTPVLTEEIILSSDQDSKGSADSEHLADEQHAIQLISGLKGTLPNPHSLLKIKAVVEDPKSNLSESVLTQALIVLTDNIRYKKLTTKSAFVCELHLRTIVSVLETIRKMQETLGNLSPLWFDLLNRLFVSPQLSIFKLFQRRRLASTHFSKRHFYSIQLLVDYASQIIYCLTKRKCQNSASGSLARGIANVLDYGNFPGLFPNAGYNTEIKHLWDALSVKYAKENKVTKWYLTVGRLREMHSALMTWQMGDGMKRNAPTLQKHAELQLIEILWLYSDINTTSSASSPSYIPTKAQPHRPGRLTRKRSLKSRDVIIMNVLDITLSLVRSSDEIVSLACCYLIVIEVLKRSGCDYVVFKALEVLAALEKRDGLTFASVGGDLAQISPVLGRMSDRKRHLVSKSVRKRQKMHSKLMPLTPLTVRTASSSQIPPPSLPPRQLTRTLLELISSELTCPVNLEFTGDWCVLECGHAISSAALENWRESKRASFDPVTCHLCRREVKEDDVSDFRLHVVYKGVCRMLGECENLGDSSNVDSIESTNGNSCDNGNDNSGNNNDSCYEIIGNVKNNPGNTQTRIKKSKHPAQKNGIRSFKNRCYAEAAKCFTQVLQYYPTSYTALCDRANAYKSIPEYSKAISDATMAIRLNPLKPRAWRLRGYIEGLRDHYTTAFIELGIALQLDPNNAIALIGRGNLFRWLDQYEQAIVDLNKGLEFEPDNPFGLEFRGDVYRLLERFEEALEDLNRALELREPNDRTFALASRGAAYFRLERFDEALGDLNNALKLDPLDDFARVTRVKVYMAMNRHDEARKELERLYEDGSASRH